MEHTMEMLSRITSLLIELNAFSASIRRSTLKLSSWKTSCIAWIATSVPAFWPARTCNAPAASYTSFLATYIATFPAIRRKTSPTPTGRGPQFLSNSIKRPTINVAKLLSSPASEICIYLIQILLTKYAKDFRKPTNEEPNEGEDILRQLSASKPDCTHPSFHLIVALKLSSSSIPSKTALCIGVFWTLQ